MASATANRQHKAQVQRPAVCVYNNHKAAFVFLRIIAPFSSIFSTVDCNEFVVETFRKLELSHEDSKHAQFISALILVAFISLVLIASVALFRCYILYCQSYENIRRFHSPLYRQTRAGYTAARPQMTLSNGDVRVNVNGGTFTFQSIFTDETTAADEPGGARIARTNPNETGLQIV